MHKRQDVYVQKQCDADNEAHTHGSCTNRKQHNDAQEQYNADNVDDPYAVPNPMVTDDNNNMNQSLVWDPIINEDQNFLSEQFREDHTK